MTDKNNIKADTENRIEQIHHRKVCRFPMVSDSAAALSETEPEKTSTTGNETISDDHIPFPKEEQINDLKPLPLLQKKKFRKRNLFWIIPTALITLAVLGYLTIVYVPIPLFRTMRNIYIETAMTTGDHQWLATKFIPEHIINDVTAVSIDTDAAGGLSYLQEKKNAVADNVTERKNDPSGNSHSVKKTDSPVDDILGLGKMKVGDKDYAGNKILVVDKEEGLFISEITGTGYKGRVMLIDDPSRVFIGTTPEKKKRGYRIKEMMEYYGNIVAGINASGFNDPNDCGDGKDIIGFCMSEGQTWGTYIPSMASIVLTDDDRLVVGYSIKNWEDYNIRDGMQFGPILIADGKNIIDEKSTAGYGIHPRTAIGQREDGVIILLVIDGRDPLYSIGCTVGNMTAVMASYGAINAGCCDGGSSVVMAYNGEVINHNSSLNPTYGRAMPNAFLVRSKKTKTK